MKHMEKKCAEFLIDSLPAIMCSLRQNYCAQSVSGLTLQQYRLMSDLLTEPSSTSELAQKFAVSLPAISRMISALEKDGWVKKIESKTDKRQASICLTKQGEKILRESKENFFSQLVPRLELLSMKEKQTLIDAMSILNRLAISDEQKMEDINEHQTKNKNTTAYAGGDKPFSRMRKKSKQAG